MFYDTDYIKVLEYGVPPRLAKGLVLTG